MSDFRPERRLRSVPETPAEDKARTGVLAALGRYGSLVALVASFGLVLNYAFLDNANPSDLVDRRIAISLAPLFHVLGFSALAMFASIFWPRRTGGVVFCLLAAAAGIEIVQMFVPDRTASIPDLFWSSTGVAAGMSIPRLLTGPRR